MSEGNLTIENTPQLLIFMRLWMSSGPMVLTTVEEIAQSNSDKKIELPEIQGRDFYDELRTFHTAFGELIERLA